MRKFIAIFLTLIFLLGLAGAGLYVLYTHNRLPFFTEKPKVSQVTNRQDTYELAPLDDDNGSVFTNKVQGYTLTLPKQATVHFNSSQSTTRVVVRDGLTIDVFKEHVLPKYTDSNYYVNAVTNHYPGAPNSFTNQAQHKILSDTESKVAGYDCRMMLWDRAPLARVQDDRTHYMSLDFKLSSISGGTFFIKSLEPIDENVQAELLAICNTFINGEPSVAPVFEKDPSERRNLDELNEETKKAYTTYFGEEAKLTWGIFDPKYSNAEFDNVAQMEETLNTHFVSIVQYMDVTRTVPEETLAKVLHQAKADNRLVELTIQTVMEENGNNQVYDVLSGAHDEYFKRLSAVIRDSGATVLLRIGNEMNGDWCLYSPIHLSRDPEIYQAFYRYLVDFFKAEGVHNQMLYVWNPNGASFPGYAWNDPMRCWPGNAYVDVVGMTAYNTGTYYPGEKWSDFDSLYKDMYNTYLSQHDQPIMITEFACSSIGGDKLAWTKDMLKKIDKHYPKIKMAIWWNHADYDPAKTETMSRPYFMFESDELTQTWQDYFKRKNNH